MHWSMRGLVVGAALLASASAGWAETVTGTISTVDLNSSPRTLEVTDDTGAVRTLNLDEQAQVRHNGQDVAESHLAAGQRVSVTVEDAAGRPVAMAVMIEEPDRASLAPSATVERTEIRSEQLESARPSARAEWDERADEDLDVDAEVDASRAEDRRLSRIEEPRTRVERTVGYDAWDLQEFRIVPTGTMHPGASIGGPMTPEGGIRAALPLGRETESIQAAPEDRERTARSVRREWSEETTVVD
jgi:hypothetical protein